MAAGKSTDAVACVGSVVQDAYEHGGGRRGHHVRVRLEAIGQLLDRSEAYACVEHLVENCFECGRTPGEHAEHEKRARDGYETALDHEHKPRPKCRCKLAKGDALP